jgi:hypothetical protein
MTQYLDAATREPHPDQHYRTTHNVGGKTVVRCRDCDLLLVPSEPARLADRSNPRLEPPWLEDAAALAGRELFAQAVSGLDPTPAQLEQARTQWDTAGENSRVGSLKPAYIDRGRKIIAASAPPILQELLRRDHEITELLRGRGHFHGGQP